ncbi:hypothetical protein [Streptomyces diastaticus]
MIKAAENRGILKEVSVPELQKLVNTFKPESKKGLLVSVALQSELQSRFEARISIISSRGLVRCLEGMSDMRIRVPMSKMIFRTVLIEELISRHPEARVASDEWERAPEGSDTFEAGPARLVIAAVRSIL